MWTAAACPRVLRARASGPGAFDAAVLDARVVAVNGIEHVAIGREDGLLRIDVVEGSVRHGPTSLIFELPHDRDFRERLAALHLFDAMLTDRRLWTARDARIRRAALALRAHDARAAGASLREIAHVLLASDDWPGAGDCVKSQARRLIAAGDRLVGNGPLALVHG